MTTTRSADPLEVLIAADRIQARVRELAEQISRDYADRDLLLVGVLKGCFIFLADLARHITIPLGVEFLRVASYGAATETSGVVQIRMDLDAPIAGRDVLLVEDILDTGLTLNYLKRHLDAFNPRSMKTCVLLDKRVRRLAPLDAEYVGFEIEDRFVVGYGLDFDERYRQMADVCVLNQAGP